MNEKKQDSDLPQALLDIYMLEGFELLYTTFFPKSKGELILRIEDTDQNRLVKNAEQNLISMLEWSGITFDEGPHIGGEFGPYRQSERLSIYKKYFYKLIENNHAYPCFYSSERLKNLLENYHQRMLPSKMQFLKTLI